ncbi:MAG: rod-binding protein [Pseudomonadota bacterium]
MQVSPTSGASADPQNALAGATVAAPPRSDADALAGKAKELEAAFLSEMLKAAGVGKPLESFGGGAGEDAFAGFLVREYATMMADRGGIGLAESIVKALSAESK